ncbi:hypothetical protein FDB72_10545 [Clostridium botulinum]|nr:hypothetical protein [Clostridium botulinum]CAL83918.1 hypothetical phage protein [Clostridium botulinum A str. ATCC 3502]MBN3442662.1 hypothetical protein [Clostridium botulinum]NFC47383.1 hypothetical protein [Clostridium botulinum]NFL69699.1 hypothetical protein [Clostridium botulinum]
MYYNTKTVIRGVFMEISKEEFVKNILKAQAKRRRRREQEYKATVIESMNRCRKKSSKRHIRLEGQR